MNEADKARVEEIRALNGEQEPGACLLRLIDVFMFTVTDVTTERDVAWQEIERLRDEPCYQFALTLPPGRGFVEFGGNISNRLYTLKREHGEAESQLTAAREEIERLIVVQKGLITAVHDDAIKLTAADAKGEKLEAAIIQHSKFCALHFGEALADTKEGK